MARTGSALRTFVVTFALGLVVGSAVRDRTTGLKAGLALGIVGVLVTSLLYGRLGGDDDTFYGIDRVETREPAE